MMTGILADDLKPLVVGMATTQALLDASPDTIYALIRARELDSYLEGKRRKVTMASIEALIAKRVASARTDEYSNRMRTLRAKPRVKSLRRSQASGGAA
jgi:hypothetical protein